MQELHNYVVPALLSLALIFDLQRVYCSSKTGYRRFLLGIVSTTENLKYLTSLLLAPFMPEVPAIVASNWDRYLSTAQL